MDGDSGQVGRLKRLLFISVCSDKMHLQDNFVWVSCEVRSSRWFLFWTFGVASFIETLLRFFGSTTVELQVLSCCTYARDTILSLILNPICLLGLLPNPGLGRKQPQCLSKHSSSVSVRIFYCFWSSQSLRTCQTCLFFTSPCWATGRCLLLQYSTCLFYSVDTFFPARISPSLSFCPFSWWESRPGRPVDDADGPPCLFFH